MGQFQQWLNHTYQNSTDQGHLKHCGSQVKYQSTENKADAPGASVDGFWQSSCLPAQMEGQVQVVKVQENILGNPPDWILSYLPKYCISCFIK